MKCPICSKVTQTDIQIVEGYVAGTKYMVYECSNCETQFISDKYDKKIYETIYSAQGSFGYERYAKYAEEIKSQENPLDWLAVKEPAYLYVRDYLSGKTSSTKNSDGNFPEYVPKKNLRILEVGCGDGYLTYALNEAGHECVGIDISMEAVTKAIKTFGNYYQAIDLKDFQGIAGMSKFDLIISTETIEHLADPNKFVSECKRLLAPGGEILLTSPNKDYRSKGTTWQTEAPPVHRFWLGHKSFEFIAKRARMQVEFLPCIMPMDMERNNIVAYFSSRGTNRFGPVLDKKGTPLPSSSSVTRKLLRDFFMWAPVRYFCNGLTLYVTKIKEAPTLGVVLR